MGCENCKISKDSPECKEERNICKTIIGALSEAQPPDVGTEKIAVARGSLWQSIMDEHIGYIQGTRKGSILYIFGQYGAGKTFFCNFARDKVWNLWESGFATSYVDVKRFEDLIDYVGLYKAIVKNIRFPHGEYFGLEQIFDLFVGLAPSRIDLNNLIRKYGISSTIAPLIKHYYQGGQLVRDVVLEWISGAPKIRARDLHLIGKKGFMKIEEEDVDEYLCGIKDMIRALGYNGLVVFIDETEPHEREFDDYDVRRVLANIKRIHNSVNIDPRFSQMVFLFVGTLSIWGKIKIKDEAQKQRIDAVWKPLNPLIKDDYIELFEKIMKVYDCCFQTSISDRVNIRDLENWVDSIIKKRGGKIELLTVRDFISLEPTPDTCFMRKLDELRREGTKTGLDVFA